MSDEHATDAASGGPTDDPHDWNDDFAAEATDHLAEAARAAQVAGATDAGAEALRRFGSLEKTWLKCFWVHEGDHLMFRTLQTAAAVLTAVLLAVLAGATWQGQRSLAARLDDVAASLESVADAQGRLEKIQTALAERREEASAQTPAAPVLQGMVYMGDPSKPAADFPLWLLGKSSNFRRLLRTTPDGRFDTGLLPPDIYTIEYTPTDENGNKGSEFTFYSDKLDLTTGEPIAELSFNAALLNATVQVEFSSPPPVIVETTRGRLRVLPFISLVSWDGTATALSEDSRQELMPLGSLPRVGGRLRGVAMQGPRPPQSLLSEQYFAEMAEAATALHAAASGNYLVVVRCWVRPESAEGPVIRQSVSPPLPLMDATALREIELAPGDHVTIKLNGFDAQLILDANRSTPMIGPYDVSLRRALVDQYKIAPMGADDIHIDISRND